MVLLKCKWFIIWSQNEEDNEYIDNKLMKDLEVHFERKTAFIWLIDWKPGSPLSNEDD